MFVHVCVVVYVWLYELVLDGEDEEVIEYRYPSALNL